jgi:glycosyltransferase involved in cell wall biosynthesis
VCGDAALYCDPGNPADIAEKIRLLMSSAALQMEMKERGIERARLFTWEACADETWTVISRVLERG